MHELPFAKSIFNAVMKKAEENEATRVCKVVIEVGELRDFVPDIVDKYWMYVTRGSMAEDSHIEMHVIPATISCHRCQTIYPVNRAQLYLTRCPQCNCDTGTMVTGRKLRITGIEIR